ncbi:hypothetical protein ASF10_21370 [Flavobacterium sp. Leaf82]|nr:hypothetical protein ASF10_21370 [Flavobacterium sp. Leaf82]
MNKEGVSSTINVVSKYWIKKTFGREDLPHEQHAVLSFMSSGIDFSNLGYFHKLTGNNELAQFTVVSSVYSFLLKRLTSDFDGLPTPFNFNNSL